MEAFGSRSDRESSREEEKSPTENRKGAVSCATVIPIFPISLIPSAVPCNCLGNQSATTAGSRENRAGDPRDGGPEPKNNKGCRWTAYGPSGPEGGDQKENRDNREASPAAKS